MIARKLQRGALGRQRMDLGAEAEGVLFAGGSWYSGAWYCRSACRHRSGPASAASALGFGCRRDFIALFSFFLLRAP